MVLSSVVIANETGVIGNRVDDFVYFVFCQAVWPGLCRTGVLGGTGKRAAPGKGQSDLLCWSVWSLTWCW
jgi:hypothetical protein